ncbi:YIP1 family protein [Patescibacteria group bacterium]
MDEHQHHNLGEDIKDEFNEATETIKEMAPSGKFDVMKELKDAVEVVKMKTEKIHTVAMRKSAALPALLIILAGIIAILAGEYLNIIRLSMMSPLLVAPTPILMLLTSFLIYLVSTLGIIFVYELIGTHIFKGKGDFGQLFRVIGYGNLILIAAIVPILRGVALVWYGIIVYEAIKHIKQLEPIKAVLTIIISMIVVSLIAAVISLLFGNIVMDIYGLGLSYFR